MATRAEKKTISQAGYLIEDMHKVWGDKFAGQFRWINDNLTGDTFGQVQYSLDAAVDDAVQFYKKTVH